MKRPLAVFLLACAVGTTAFFEHKYPTQPPSYDTVFIQNNSEKEPPVIKVPVLTELGIPTQSSYPSRIVSRNPWDMAVFDGRLYIGCGDYDKNTGPCDVWQYDPETLEWTNTGAVNDEAITNFEEIDGQLIITGADPKDGWEYGSFYTLTEDGWQTDRTVPFGVHMFDIAQFEGKLFYGIGTANNTQSPVQMTLDGASYTNVPFFIGQDALLGNDAYSFSRCYNLFETKTELYAFCFLYSDNAEKISYGFFKFDGESFHLVSTVRDLNIKTQCMTRQVPLNTAITFKGKHYFSTGYLYATDDFSTVSTITVPNSANVQDITVEGGKMYVLTSSAFEIEIPPEIEEEQSTFKTIYKNTVWEYRETDGFSEIYTFNYDFSAMSFAKDGDTFYIGIGQRNDQTAANPTPLNGTIIKVEFEEKIIYN